MPLPPPGRRHLVRAGQRVIGLAGAALLSAEARAQAAAGQVVDSASRRPLPGVRVRLVRYTAADTATLPADTTPVAHGSTGRDGVFTLLAHAPGRYRVRVGDALVGPVLTLADADAFAEAVYPVPPAARVYLDFQVEKQASLRNGTLDLRYPADLQQRGLEGRVILQFVVDVSGRAEPGTTRVIESTDPGFTQAALFAVSAAQFSPALVGGRKVRQMVQLPVSFTLTSSPAPRLSRRSPGLPPFGSP